MDQPKQRGRPKDEQLTARRCEEILDAAAKMFARRGYPSTDVQLVADELGIGKGTIYRYFPTKRELFLGAVDRGMRRLLEQIHSVPADLDPLEQMAGAIRAYLSFYDANPEFVELLIQERAEFKDRAKPTYFEYRDAGGARWRSLLEGLMAVGCIRRMPVQRIMDVVGNLLYGTMFTNYFAGRQKSLEEQAQELLDIVFRGILKSPADEAGRALPDAEADPGERAGAACDR
ncbi:MAG: TetR/AcrR family transcriptional regulator [Planctomycetota bacterium]